MFPKIASLPLTDVDRLAKIRILKELENLEVIKTAILKELSEDV